MTKPSQTTTSPRSITNPALEASTAPEVIKRTVEQALRLLDVAKAEYIIRLPDGTLVTKGDMELVTRRAVKRVPRKAHKMPYGSYTSAYKESIVNMAIGDVLCLYRTPDMLAAGVTLADISGTISSIAATTFGTDAHKIHQNKTTECIELLRTA